MKTKWSVTKHEAEKKWGKNLKAQAKSSYSWHKEISQALQASLCQSAQPLPLLHNKRKTLRPLYALVFMLSAFSAL